MIQFESVEVTNFLSHVDSRLDFTPGVHMVLGVNKDETITESNGAGKSALFEAISWAIYGNTERDYVDHNNSGNTRVYLKIVVGLSVVEITRHLNHDTMKSKLLLSVDGEEQTKHTIKETQELVDRLIPLTYKHFISSVTVLQGMNTRLSNMTPTIRKDFFSTVINYDWSKAENNSKQAIKLLQQRVSDLEDRNFTISNEESRLLGQMEALKESRMPEEILKYEGIVSAAKEDISGALERAKSLQVDIDALSTMKSKKESALLECRVNLDREARDTESLAQGKCPTCGRAYGADKVLEARIRLKEIQEEQKKSKAMQDSIDKISATIRTKITYLDSEKSRMIRATSDQASAELMLAELRKRSTQFEAVKDACRQVSESLDKVKEELSAKQSEYGYMNQVLKLVQPSGELRSYLVNAYLDVYNNILGALREYIFPESEVYLKFDSNYKGIDIGGISYNNLSGGEKRRVDILLQLAFSEFISRITDTSTNLLVVDELFDGLDLVSSMNVLTFIQEYFGEGRCLYIITHNDRIKDLAEANITIVKQDGVSIIAGGV